MFYKFLRKSCWPPMLLLEAAVFSVDGIGEWQWIGSAQGELRYAGSKWQGNTAVETFVCSKSRSQQYISTLELALARALLA